VAAGISVQLKHDATETNFDDHGWVKVLTVDGEKILAEEAKVQHNRSYGARKDLLAKMLEAVIVAVKNGEAAVKVEPADTPAAAPNAVAAREPEPEPATKPAVPAAKETADGAAGGGGGGAVAAGA